MRKHACQRVLCRFNAHRKISLMFAPSCNSGFVLGICIIVSESSTCAAALRAGMLGLGCGDIVVSVAHGQNVVFGCYVGSWASNADCKERRSFTIGRPIDDSARCASDIPFLGHQSRVRM